MKLRDTRLVVPAVLTLFSAALPAIGVFYYQYDIKVLGFPLGIGLFAVAMGLLSIRAELRGPKPADAVPAQTNAFDESEGLLENPATWLQLGWIVAFAAATLVLGFLAGPSLMIALYLLWDRRGWRAAVIAAVLMAAGVWLISTYLIRAPLPMMPIFWS